MSKSSKDLAKLNGLAEALVSRIKLMETATNDERYELIEMCRILEEELIILRYKLENEVVEDVKEILTETNSNQVEESIEEPLPIDDKVDEVSTELTEKVDDENIDIPEVIQKEIIESKQKEEISKEAIHEIGSQFNVKESLYEKLSNTEDKSLGGRLQKTPIRDLKTSMSLNDRFLFTNELFKGNGEEFVNAIEELNHLQSLDDAKRLINHNWVDKYKWDWESEIVLHFVDLLDRRYLHKR